MLVERGDQLLDVIARHRLAWPPADPGLDVADVVITVEQRQNVEQPDRQHDHRGGVAGRVAQREVALTVLLDGKRLDRAQPRGGAAHGSRKFNADAT